MLQTVVGNCLRKNIELVVYCDQYRHRKRMAARAAIAGGNNLSKSDCGPKGILWRWWRDKRMLERKWKRCI
jgi:hypothetical protein